MEFEYILEKAYAVAYLSDNMIENGFEHVTSLIENLENGNLINQQILQKLQTFNEYLITYWLLLARVLSVFDKPVRTNNTCENFHLYAARGMGCR